eukprot:COSAG02_NODE_30207_length_555_cov_1.135965_1_plen_20_part_10
MSGGEEDGLRAFGGNRKGYL